MNTFKDRLLSLFEENAKPSRIATALDMSLPGFMRLYNDGFIPKAEGLIKIQEVTGCNLNWLLTGIGQPLIADTEHNELIRNNLMSREQGSSIVYDTTGHVVDVDDFIFVPRYNIHAAAGGGHFNDAEKPMFTMAFRKKWVESYLRANPKDLSVIDIKGDSMEGVLNERDVILVNHSLNAPDDGLYVLRIGESLIVKQTQVLPNGRLLVKSANQNYDPFELNLLEVDTDVKIIGRVVWFGRQV